MKTKATIFFFTVIVFVFKGCASVPKDVVRLSDRIGHDLTALHESYDRLIHEYFNRLRDERLAYLDDVWYPRFIDNWMESGELQAIAAGEKIWSEVENRLVAVPDGSSAIETRKTLRDWVDYALYAYETKQEKLLAPLDEQEASLRSDVNSAFHQVIRANAAVTAHLNSIREVKEVQDETLSTLGIGELRDSINEKLQQASEAAKAGLEAIRKADREVETIDF